MESNVDDQIFVLGNEHLSNISKTLEDFAAVVVLAEGIFFADSPWGTNAVGREIAQELHSEFHNVPLAQLTLENGLDFAAQYFSNNPTKQVEIELALSSAEFNWSLGMHLNPKVGTRQTLQAIIALNKRVHVISTCSCAIVQAITNRVAPNLKNIEPQGRTQLSGSTDTLLEQLSVVRAQYPNQNILIIASDIQAQNLENALVSTPNVCFALLVAGTPHQPEHAIDMVDLALSFDLPPTENRSMAKAQAARDRLRELKTKSILTNEEMSEMSLYEGGHRIIGNSERFGYFDQP